MRTTPWEVATDCPRCHAESARLELFDPAGVASRFGVPVTARCRLCGWAVTASDYPVTSGCPGCHADPPADHTAGDPCPACGFVIPTTEAAPAVDLRDPTAARAAIARWAADEGEADADVFAIASFGLTVDEVAARLAAGEPIPSLFDVLEHLFPSQGATHGARLEGGVVAGDAPVAPAAHPPPAPVDPRLPGRALVSVMLADGEIQADEAGWITRWLAGNGHPPVAEADLRVWRAWELGPGPTGAARDALVDALVEVAWRDRDPDPHELRLITEYAGAWGVAPDDVAARHTRLEARYATPLTRLYRALSGYVRTRG